MLLEQLEGGGIGGGQWWCCWAAGAAGQLVLARQAGRTVVPTERKLVPVGTLEPLLPCCHATWHGGMYCIELS